MVDTSVLSATTPRQTQKFEIPTNWTRSGLVLGRSGHGDGQNVIGDPCIVWDPELNGWRMFLFCDPPGHAQAICRSATNVGPGQWELVGRLEFTNPHAVPRATTHKPYIVQNAHLPNHAALIEGRYMLVSVGHLPTSYQKCVHRAWAENLAGPWTWDANPLITPGKPGDFDDKHVDAVSGIYFPERNECLYYYMGYPRTRQERTFGAFGSAQAVAIQRMDEPDAEKIGIILPPKQQREHWACGYVGGLQPVPGRRHRWVAIVNASPTAPVPDQDKSISREEPPPSLGGVAYCDEEFPIKGWQWADEPLEWISDVPSDAIANGEGVNLWRHHLLILPDGRAAVYYNSGPYGKEQLYIKWAVWDDKATTS